MRCRVSFDGVEESGKFPCGICKKGIGNNSYCIQSVINGYTKDAARLKEKLKQM